MSLRIGQTQSAPIRNLEPKKIAVQPKWAFIQPGKNIQISELQGLKKTIPAPLFTEILAYAGDPSLIDKDNTEAVYGKILKGYTAHLREDRSLPGFEAVFSTQTSYENRVFFVYQSCIQSLLQQTGLNQTEILNAFYPMLKEGAIVPLDLGGVKAAISSARDRSSLALFQRVAKKNMLPKNSFMAGGLLQMKKKPMHEQVFQLEGLLKEGGKKEIAKVETLELDMPMVSCFSSPLSSLSPAIGMFSSLKTLSLKRHGLGSLPDEVCQLVHLELLDVSCNKLSSLPGKFFALSKLSRLFIFNNCFPNAPLALAYLPQLHELSVDLSMHDTSADFLNDLQMINGVRVIHFD